MPQRRVRILAAWLACCATAACGARVVSAGDAAADAAPDGAVEDDAEALPDVAIWRHGAPPSLRIRNRGGPVLPHVRLVTVTFRGYEHESFVRDAGRFVVTSPWLAATGREYGVGEGAVLANVALDAPAGGATLDDVEIQRLLADRVADGALPRGPDGTVDGVLYAVYVPLGTSVTLQGYRGCLEFLGYHNEVQGRADHLAYAVVLTCDVRALGLQVRDALTFTASHEIIEAATDPFPYSDPTWQLTDGERAAWGVSGAEVADQCDGLFVRAGGHLLARSWSNVAAAAGSEPCVPRAP